MAAARSGSIVYWTSAGLQAGLNFGENRQRIFGARIVAGGDDEIASLARGLAHLGPLGAVAIAAAAEQRDHAPAGLRGHLPRQGSQIAQRIVGVRVVHDHGERLARIDRLKAARNGLEAAEQTRRDRSKETPRACAAVKAASRLRMFTSPARRDVTRAAPAGRFQFDDALRRE